MDLEISIKAPIGFALFVFLKKVQIMFYKVLKK
jgi:hypothetical protein